MLRATIVSGIRARLLRRFLSRPGWGSVGSHQLPSGTPQTFRRLGQRLSLLDRLGRIHAAKMGTAPAPRAADRRPRRLKPKRGESPNGEPDLMHGKVVGEGANYCARGERAPLQVNSYC